MTNPTWAADIDVDAELAARLIRAQFAPFRTAHVVPFGIGWDNAAFLAGGETVFRFPRRRVSAPLIVREIAVLPLVAPHMPLAVPVPRYVGTATDEYPWTFAGYELIGGRTACSIVLTDVQRAALAEPLARFLRALHDLDPSPFVARGLAPDEIGRLDHDKRLPLAAQRVTALDAADVPDEAHGAVAWMRAHPPEPIPAAERRVVHGDLYARHVLLDPRALPVAVIDWGDVHLGDPALDLAAAFLMLPASAHAAFRDVYGAVDERTWSAARYRAIYHAILELDYGVRVHDAGMRGSGTDGLRLIGSARA